MTEKMFLHIRKHLSEARNQQTSSIAPKNSWGAYAGGSNAARNAARKILQLLPSFKAFKQCFQHLNYQKLFHDEYHLPFPAHIPSLKDNHLNLAKCKSKRTLRIGKYLEVQSELTLKNPNFQSLFPKPRFEIPNF